MEGVDQPVQDPAALPLDRQAQAEAEGVADPAPRLDGQRAVLAVHQELLVDAAIQEGLVVAEVAAPVEVQAEARLARAPGGARR